MMKSASKVITPVILLAWLLTGATVLAGNPRLAVNTNRPDAMYRPGEKMVFSIQLLENGKPVKGKKLRWERKGDDKKATTGELVSQDTPVTVTTSLGQPGFVYLNICAYDGTGTPLKDEENRKITFDGGAGVQPEELKGVPEPRDFNAFWRAQRQALSKQPLKYTMAPITSQNPHLLGFDVKVDCLGDKPASGYFFKPKNAVPKSLPAIVSFHAYGVFSADRREDWAERGMLAFDLNAHGVENGKDKAFYDSLRGNELKNYGLSGNDDRDKSYFLGMLLRIMRTLDFIKAQPEWDGKNLIVVGGSQGGFQALAAAGLDRQVSFCVAGKPWLCDLGGVTKGRLPGWRPGYTEALGYFDAANHAKRIKCPTVMDIGLGDYVCPPSGVAVTVNNIPGPKKLIFVQGTTHGFSPPGSKGVGACLDAHLNALKQPPVR